MDRKASSAKLLQNIRTIKDLFSQQIGKKELEYKEEVFEELKRFDLPHEIWFSFFLPSNSIKLEKVEKQIKDFFGNDLFAMKRDALKLLFHQEEIEILSDITDPFDPLGSTVALMLLELSVKVRQRILSHDFVEKGKKYWSKIGSHFGFWKIRYMLDDAIFHFLDVKNYRLISSLVEKENRTYQDLFKNITAIIEDRLEKNKIKNAKIVWRKKNICGVYEKMKTKGKSINHIMDLFGVRIIVNTVDDCYKTLEILHSLWHPFPEHEEDYIKTPKKNKYQSLHTTLQCLEKKTVEFQIRTYEMDFIAKFGPASHTKYKFSKSKKKK